MAGALTPGPADFHDVAAVNVGFDVALRFRRLPGVAAEAVWTGGAVPRFSHQAGTSRDEDNRAGTLFAVWRSPGQPYLKVKGRAGVGRVSVYDETGTETRIAPAGSVGLSWRVPEGTPEIGQTFFNDDAWLLSISYLYDL